MADGLRWRAVLLHWVAEYQDAAELVDDEPLVEILLSASTGGNDVALLHVQSVFKHLLHRGLSSSLILRTFSCALPTSAFAWASRISI